MLFLCFSFQNDLFNYRNILCVSFFNHGLIYYLINVYYDLSQSALKYLKDTEVDLNNVLIMTGDFNIRDNFWDPSFLYHSSHRNTLFDIADFFHLEIFKPTEYFPTRYSNNIQDSNSVLDLVFLQSNLTEHDNYPIHPNWRLTSDHAPITVNILIVEECIHTMKQSLTKNSKKEDHFIEELTNFIKNLKTNSILNSNTLEEIVNSLAINIDSIWHKHSKNINIIKHSKVWWDNNCWRNLNIYRQSKQLEDWKKFKEMVKRMKCYFFDTKIDEIANKKCGLWELINWVKKKKLPVIKAIQYNGCPCIKLENLWEALYNSFNSAQNH